MRASPHPVAASKEKILLPVDEPAKPPTCCKITLGIADLSLQAALPPPASQGQISTGEEFGKHHVQPARSPYQLMFGSWGNFICSHVSPHSLLKVGPSL